MIDVFLDTAATYAQAAALLPSMLDRLLPDLRGLKVLVKPNFVALRNARLACTHPQIICSVASHCKAKGARVTVGDSPTFGTAQAIAHEIGLCALLNPLDIPIISLSKGVTRMSAGIPVEISADALDADLIINLPKCKAHSQMRYTGAVKNLFGCVVGVRKAWLHARHGDKGNTFPRMICGFGDILPPAISLMDGVEAMHVTGPIHGSQFNLNLIGGSRSAVALDTAMGMIFGAKAEDWPVWKECCAQGRPGAEPDQLRFPFLSPDAFDTREFCFPSALKPESFRPGTLLKSLIKRTWMTR